MNNPNTESNVLQLIKSLNKNEKRYVALYLSKHKKGSNLLHLFVLLSENDPLSDRDIPNRIGRKKLVSQLSANKYMLYKLILDALHVFQLRNSPFTRLTTMISQAEILSAKGLYTARHELLLKAEALAKEHQLYNFQLAILDLLDLNLIGDSRDIHHEIKSLSHTVVKQQKIKYLNHKTYALFRKFGYRQTTKQRKSLRKKSIESLEKQKFSLHSWYNQYYYWNIYFNYYDFTGDYAEKYKSGLQLLNLFHHHPAILRLQTWKRRYITHLCNLYAPAGRLKQRKTMEFIQDELNRMNILPAEKLTIDINILDVHIQTGEFYEAEKFIPVAQNDITLYEKRWNTFPNLLKNKMLLYFNLGFIHLSIKKYSKALYWFNEIKKAPKKQMPDASFTMIVRLLYLITLYEMEEYGLLEYETRAAERYFLKLGKPFELDKVVFQFIRKAPHVIDKGELLKIMKRTKNELQKILKLKSTVQALGQYFDFISWFESKIENRPFTEIVKEKAKSKKASI